MATKKELVTALGLLDVELDENKEYSHADLTQLLKKAKEQSDDGTAGDLKGHEVIALERLIRKAVTRDERWRKGVKAGDKKAAKKALKKLGRKETAWDPNIDLNMVNTKSIVKPKTSKNSID